MKRVSLLLLLCLAPVLVSKAQLPCDSIEASLITCSPGDEVYSLYGHTALRCRNFTRKADVAFNYGVFSFGQPHFLWRFILGQCDYMVLGIPWDVFIKEYEERGSRVTQQTLNLKVKFREDFRPFAPIVLEEDAGLYFKNCDSSPYMVRQAALTWPTSALPISW